MQIGQMMNAAPQDVVLGDHFFQIEPVFQPLQPVRGRAASPQGLRNRFVRIRSERDDELVQQTRHMVVQRGDIQLAC